MLLNNNITIKDAISFYNGEEIDKTHLLTIDLENGSCKKNIDEDDLVYDYTKITVHKENDSKDFIIKANDYIDDESLEDLRLFCGYSEKEEEEN